MTLDATPKSATANSYVTVARANTILTEEWLNAKGWTATSSTPTREAALIMATTLMDLSFSYNGSPTTDTQALRLPRVGLSGPDGFYLSYDLIPAIAERACALLANYLLTSDRLADPALVGLGFSSASVGPLSVTVDKAQVKDIIPRDVVLLMTPIAALENSASSGLKIIKLERS